jgi:probable phosphoglycerate mutase
LGQAAVINPDLAEWNYGDYEGLRSEEICAARPGWNIFRDGCPNGEQPKEVSDRADRLISGLRKLSGNVALFSHGQFGCVLASRWIGLPVAASGSFVFDTASYGVLGFDRHRPSVPVIESWNAIGREIPELRRTPDVVHANESGTNDSHAWGLCEPMIASRLL